MNYGQIIHKKYGYIKISNNFIEEFVIYKKYRGKGYARKLAEFLPEQCSLIAYPLYGKFGGRGLSKELLIKFYKSLGFRFELDENRNSIMTRRSCFHNDLWGRKARDRARREAKRMRLKWEPVILESKQKVKLPKKLLKML